ncbi:MAG TPA: hypothetical protein VME67_25395 [Mycobacterium sp.]|nr:hypothetical protein [Mycobacterium sp.]HTX97878.1 hypothetical protein [Mycobacterium sp.]
MSDLLLQFVDGWRPAAYAALKALALFVTAAAAFRLTQRRTIAEFTPFEANPRRCRITREDLDAIVRQHGHRTPADVGLALFETKGVVSVFDEAKRSG